MTDAVARIIAYRNLVAQQRDDLADAIRAITAAADASIIPDAALDEAIDRARDLLNTIPPRITTDPAEES